MREQACPAGCDNGAVLADVCCRVYLGTGECCNQPDREDVACEVCGGRGFIEVPDDDDEYGECGVLNPGWTEVG